MRSLRCGLSAEGLEAGLKVANLDGGQFLTLSYFLWAVG